MKLHLISDIHNRPGRRHAIPQGLDYGVLVVAGDIDEDETALVEWLGTASGGRPVVAVLGNHDYYSTDLECFTVKFDRIRNELACRFSHVHLLENESVVIDGVRFLGATLWTDFGGGHGALARYAGRTMRDYSMIGASAWLASPANRADFEGACDDLRYTRREIADFVQTAALCPPITSVLHRRSRKYIASAMRQDAENWSQTIVVTHHAPSLRSLNLSMRAMDPGQWTERLDYRWDTERIIELAAYGSDVAAWRGWPHDAVAFVHGHIHQTAYTADFGAALVCNSKHDFRFSPDLVLDSDHLAMREGLFGLIQSDMAQLFAEMDQHLAEMERYAEAAPVSAAQPINEAFIVAWQAIAERFAQSGDQAWKLFTHTLAPLQRSPLEWLRNGTPRLESFCLSPSLVDCFAQPGWVMDWDCTQRAQAALDAARDWRSFLGGWRDLPAKHDTMVAMHEQQLAAALDAAGLRAEILTAPIPSRWLSDLIFVRCAPNDVERVFATHRELPSAGYFRLRIAGGDTRDCG